MSNPVSGNPTSGLTLPASWTDYLASSSYTAADVLAKIKTVDGAASGLDAMESARFLFGDASARGTTIEGSSLDSIAKSGMYQAASTVTNVPTANNYLVLHVQGSDSANYAWQIAKRYDGTGLYLRYKNTTWSAWCKLWDADNDGASSGLDADLLDGLESASASTASTIAARDASGNIAAKGIAFPATQSASADANTLDDYEEGTWTPGISLGGGTTGITYTNQYASYTKIGRKVFFEAYITLSAKGSDTGNLLITGLPFTVQNDTHNYSPVAFNISLVAYSGMVIGRCTLNDTTITVYQITEAGTRTQLTDTALSATSSIMVSGFYNV